ncbi:MAG: hypothetical protein V1676_03700 [Candidatus Diapherotrites archaeon]
MVTGTELAVLFSLGEVWGDLNLVLKIIVLITVASFVRGNLGDSALSWIVIIGFGWFVLFDGWMLFGPVYVLYILLGLGVSGILVDFFFISMNMGAPMGGQQQEPISSGTDVLQKRMVHGHMQGHMATHKPRPPMGMG